MSYKSNFEEQYINNLKIILNKGILQNNKRTGVVTLRIPFSQLSIDLENEVPILLSKKVFWKTAVKELLWMYQQHSNKVDELGSKIWDQWKLEDGTIGRSYGYQVGKAFRKDGNIYRNQIDYILRTLKNDSSNRQCVIDLWQVQDLNYMSLPPCVYSSVWNIIDNKLNCMLVQRSGDYPIGVPFDIFEFGLLTILLSNHLGVRPGILNHVIADSHIYENQIEGIHTQIARWDNNKLSDIKPNFDIKLKSFWNIEVDDINIKDYNPCDTIIFDIAK